MKKINKIFKNELWPSSNLSSSRLQKTKKIVAWLLIIIIPASLILSIPFLKEREVIILGKEISSKTIINLGYLGLVFPSSIKNKERVNLLFLGIPGEGYHGPRLTDSIIIINSTSKGENPIGISIPRDLFIKNPYKEHYTKINALYQDNDIQGIKTVLKEITDLDIDYFIVLDLGGVKKIIDQLDGIDVVVENDVYDPQFPGPNNSYVTFSLNKGSHHLDGETTLKYLRSRHQPGGDFARIKRQQQVISILKDKILSLNPIWNLPTILKIWQTLNKHTYTNIGLDDIKYAWNLTKKTNFDEIKFITLSNQPNEETQLLISDHVMLNEIEAYILKPKSGIGNYEEIKNYINQMINNPWF